MTFKFLNDIYPSNCFLHEIFHWENNSGGFCEKDIETVEHIFFQCEFVHEFWLSFQSWIQSKEISLHHLNETSIKFAVFINDTHLECLINNLIVLGKHYPQMYVFKG